MAFIGTPLDTRNTFQSLQGKRFNGDGSTTAFTLDVAPSSTLDIEVFVGNVRQDPNSAYTLSGTTLTFTGAPPSGTNNIYVVHQAKSVGTIDPPATESTAKTFSGGVTLSGTTTHSGALNVTGGLDSRGGAVFNEGSADEDFRVESNGNANMFIVDAGQDQVGIGAVPTQATLHVQRSDTGALNDNNSNEFMIEDATCGMTIGSATDGEGHIHFSDSDDADVGTISYFHSTNHLQFRVNAAERVRIDSSGRLFVAKTGQDATVVGLQLQENGQIVATAATTEPLFVNRQNDDGNLVSLRQAAAQEGTITVSGSTVAYNTFCGTHWSRLADNSKPTILRGTVIESIGTMMNWYQAVAEVAESTDSEGNVTPAHQTVEDIALPDGKSAGDAVTFTSNGKEYTGVYVKEDNEQLPMCKISDTADSKAVYGVFMTWDDHDDGLDGDVNDMHVASLGAFVVRIHKDQTVAIGDYLVSNGDGTAKKQADDILRSNTIAKVTSTTKTHEYADGSYCVPCTLHCG
jgi:hypothetical protein